eukprot:8076169-Pyramimonas_sp.AAC.1
MPSKKFPRCGILVQDTRPGRQRWGWLRELLEGGQVPHASGADVPTVELVAKVPRLPVHEASLLQGLQGAGGRREQRCLCARESPRHHHVSHRLGRIPVEVPGHAGGPRPRLVEHAALCLPLEEVQVQTRERLQMAPVEQRRGADVYCCVEVVVIGHGGLASPHPCQSHQELGGPV